MGEYFTCYKCGETEENEKAVKLTLESDMQNMTGTYLKLCHFCGIEAKLLITDKLIKNKERPYLEKAGLNKLVFG